jgi:hypothetical protein
LEPRGVWCGRFAGSIFTGPTSTRGLTTRRDEEFGS